MLGHRAGPYKTGQMCLKSNPRVLFCRPVLRRSFPSCLCWPVDAEMSHVFRGRVHLMLIFLRDVFFYSDEKE